MEYASIHFFCRNFSFLKCCIPLQGTYDVNSFQGLYDPRFEHDACGVGFVVNIDGTRSHDIITQGLEVLINLAHRGAVSSDDNTGDGAGILTQIPHDFFASSDSGISFTLPDPGTYGVGMIFIARQSFAEKNYRSLVETVCEEWGQAVLGWREVPVDNSGIGALARDNEPRILQVFIENREKTRELFERKLYLIRRCIEKEACKLEYSNYGDIYICSLSSETVVYKGLLLAHQIENYYSDLASREFKSSLALIHQRYSTNTFPTWELAQPFRYIGHNGEINTLRGNINMMKARYGSLVSRAYGEDLQKLLPVTDESISDSANFDRAVEFMMRNGRSLVHALMMMVPEAWGPTYRMGPDLRGFFDYNSILMEPWDGPAAVSFTDGRRIGALLDRNGLRPARYLITTDGFMVLASEAGVLDIDPSRVKKKGALSPGKMILADTGEGRVIENDEIKSVMARMYPYRRWIGENRVELRGLFDAAVSAEPDTETLISRQAAFGYSKEEVTMVLRPMSEKGKEAVGSMGADIPLAVLSRKPQLLYSYFKQLFAQVTNPPIDPLREELVMSVMSHIGRGLNILEDTPHHAIKLKLSHPVLTNDDLGKIRNADQSKFPSVTIPVVFKASEGIKGIRDALDTVCRRADRALDENHVLLILSDRDVGPEYAPIPSLLALGAVHTYLVNRGRRAEISIIMESGEARETMHFALLLGYGASAVNPYLALETIVSPDVLIEGLSPEHATENYITAVETGLKKTFSRMGISTLRSYRGAQIFEAVGLSKECICEFFPGTVSRIGGIGLETIVQESLARHRRAFSPSGSRPDLEIGGIYRYRKTEERHLWTPQTISLLQRAARRNDESIYREYAGLINSQAESPCTLRSLFSFKKGTPVPLESVEPEESIMKRFVTGAMSFGSISREAHTTLAAAMNTVGGQSNTGEGGEDPARFTAAPGEVSTRSAVKQVASGRFGVTSQYLVNADEIQIKISQGAKPGEGGQLPGHKVDEIIARVRHSTPGVTLISPPPHHDIYSIEDLAQLIFDLKNANPDARVSVKLVSEAGVGTIAAGVAKGYADMVLISGYDGGTGASPLTSIKHAGLPWELGLAETQQTLVSNNLRSRIRIQADGQMKTGRDVVTAALLGAEEFGFATAPLVVCGCVMMRKCHQNTCPAGIATQDPELRKRFSGKPEYVINYFRFIAREVRELMAELGFVSFDDMVGHSHVLEKNSGISFPKTDNLDFSTIFYFPASWNSKPLRCTEPQPFDLSGAIDNTLITRAEKALERKQPLSIRIDVRNTDRAVGTMLSSRVTALHGEQGLPDDTVSIACRGTAGQSFGAFCAPGVTLNLEGEANDYVGKGLSGGKLIVVPPTSTTYLDRDNVLIGNVALYGATSGEAYFRGIAGERFAVRNSGVRAVVEGVGYHGCEYMTGGTVVILGRTGLNFGAGMSGGIAYVLDSDGLFDQRCNLDMVDLDLLERDEDIAEVQEMISKHVEYTGSTVGRDILSDWTAYRSKFIKVFPMEYRKVLGQMLKDDAETKREVLQHG